MSEPIPERPLLLLGEPARMEREKLTPAQGGRRFRRPSPEDQDVRLSGKWSTLRRTLEQQKAELAPELAGTDPDLVLVMEIIGDVPDFYRAVARIEGLEYLAALDESDLDGGDVFVDSDDPDATFDGTLFLLASNQTALSEILDLWGMYQNDESAAFPRGLAPWKHVFRLLLDLRRWSAADRLRGTGALEDFAMRKQQGDQAIRAEIELWFRGDASRRAASQAAVSTLVREHGGEVLASSEIPAIAYHAMLVSLPIGAIDPLLEGRQDEVALIRADEISFVRPEAQAAVELAPVEEVAPSFESPTAPGEDPPLVGVLDGVPLMRHELLQDRVLLDDPDDWQSLAASANRQHGTAIAGLVIHGDAGRGEALERKVYMRPVLLPDGNPVSPRETVPHHELAIDLIHRSIVRMVSSPPDEGGSVKLVNLSVGDAGAQLATAMSPWARLLDYLSYEYRLTFVVSAGNHLSPISIGRPLNDISALSPEDLRKDTLSALVTDSSRRRILSPSEAVNCLCVGAAHDDACASWVPGQRIDLLPSSGRGSEALPSPISAAGMGYRRSIKPDLLAPGGRILFRPPMTGHAVAPSEFSPAPSSLAPGLQVATPAPVPGGLNGTRHMHGTSGAAALVSHLGGLTLEELAAMSGTPIPERFWAALTKTLLVHSTSLPASAAEVREAFGVMSHERLKDAVSRFYGYGIADGSRMLRCSENRATALGWGELTDGLAERFELPLPPSLSGVVAPRRVIITVGYFAPIRVRDRRHRAAALFVNPDKDTLRVSRRDADWRTVRRGTIQHEVLEGSSAAAFVDGDALSVQVNCRSLVGRLTDVVPFGLAVTIEVPEGSRLSIYDEIAARVRARARARVRGT